MSTPGERNREAVLRMALPTGEQLVRDVAHRLGVLPTEYLREVVIATLDEVLPGDAYDDVGFQSSTWRDAAEALRGSARRPNVEVPR
jgi:hypothetical protein